MSYRPRNETMLSAWQVRYPLRVNCRTSYEKCLYNLQGIPGRATLSIVMRNQLLEVYPISRLSRLPGMTFHGRVVLMLIFNFISRPLFEVSYRPRNESRYPLRVKCSSGYEIHWCYFDGIPGRAIPPIVISSPLTT